MPLIYSIHHDGFLKRFLDTNIPVFMGKERPIFALTKTGYVFSVYATVVKKNTNKNFLSI